MKLKSTNTENILRSIVGYAGESVQSLRTQFNARLRIQKTVYLLQLHPEFKQRLSYNFNFYIRGPYSSDLADAYFDLKDIEHQMPSFAAGALKYMDKICKMEPEYLELLASVIEVMKNSPGAKKGAVISKVISLKPKYADRAEAVEKAFDSALELKKEYGLVF
ncbi:MAG: hypothetical protein JRN53_05335 [Nitrososphaerota archaeon]|nr:hypothetical protein [Nitrososphaerota archaeon]